MDGFSLPLALFLSTGAIALFSFIAVATWSDNHRREREAYYKSEALKKISESSQGDSALAMLREEERNAWRRRREGIKLGGLITVAVGLGMMIFLWALVAGHEPAYLVGLVPVLVGAALLAYAYILAPQD